MVLSAGGLRFESGFVHNFYLPPCCNQFSCSRTQLSRESRPSVCVYKLEKSSPATHTFFSLLLISHPPHAQHFPTDPCFLFPNCLHLTTISSLIRHRSYTPNELCDTTSNTKINCLSGNEAKIRVSPGARIPHDADQTRETACVIYSFGREDEVVGTSRALQVKRVPCTRKETEVEAVVA